VKVQWWCQLDCKLAGRVQSGLAQLLGQGLGQGLMKKRELRIKNVVFFVLVLIFAIFVLVLWLGRARELSFSVLAALAILFGLLGVTLTVLTVRLHETRTQKILFILTGVSAAGIPVCAILHNLMYGLFIELFGKGFWGSGGDEAVFFVLTVFVCPALFLGGQRRPSCQGENHGKRDRAPTRRCTGRGQAAPLSFVVICA